MSYLYKTSFTGCRYYITNNRKLLLKMNIRQNISINHKKKIIWFWTFNFRDQEVSRVLIMMNHHQ